MPATASRKIEHKTTRFDQRQKTLHPNGRSRRRLIRLHSISHWWRPVAKNGQIRVQRHKPDVMSMMLFKAIVARLHN
jgi:hypothetical protein